MTTGTREVEGIMPYGKGDKGDQVGEMFDSIAHSYDLMNNLMTFGLCRYWRGKALKLLENGHPDTEAILDVATGTGDVAYALLECFPKATVTGIDLSEGMLAIANEKKKELPDEKAGRLDFCCGDSLSLDFKDNSFDIVTVAYGVRNFEHLDQGISEMTRVLKPGGMLCIVELSEPEGGLLRFGYRIYAHRLIPAVGKMVSGDSRAYTYLPESIAACPQRKDMARIMERAGLCNCRWKSLTFGVVTIYLGTKRI